MSATLLKVESGLVFGVPLMANVVLQEVDYDRKAKDAEATGEAGDVIGVAIYGGQRYNCKGSYLYKGTSPYTMGQDIMSVVTALFGELTGACAVSGFGRKRSHEAFSDGNFEAIGLIGATQSTFTPS